jgi:flagellar motor switch protein FliN/FliY
MSDFINLFKDTIVSTVEGLTGFAPEVEYVDNDNVIDIETPIAQITVEVSGDATGHLNVLMDASLATTFGDLMLGGEGEARDSMDEEDLDATKEIVANIMGTLGTSLAAQNDLPTLSFQVTNIEFLDDSQSVDTGDFESAFMFQTKVANTDSPIYLLIDSDVSGVVFGEASSQEDDKQEAQDSDSDESSLSQQEMKNVSLLLDVKLPVRVRIGFKTMLLKDVLSMDIGSVVELNQLANEPLDVLVGDKVIAKGEVVIVDGNFGVQISNIGSKKERLQQLR